MCLRPALSAYFFSLTDSRIRSKYFRVAFYGQWPTSVSGKQFVYRAQPSENLGAFIDRMLSKHPKSVPNHLLTCLVRCPDRSPDLSVAPNCSTPTRSRRTTFGTEIRNTSRLRPFLPSSIHPRPSSRTQTFRTTFGVTIKKTTSTPSLSPRSSQRLRPRRTRRRFGPKRLSVEPLPEVSAVGLTTSPELGPDLRRVFPDDPATLGNRRDSFD